MTRIDLATSDLHALLQPVLPHTSTAKDEVQLSCVRLETLDQVLYAVACDRYSLAASRLALHEYADDTTLLIDRADAAAMLKLYGFSKDADPKLTLTIDTVTVPLEAGRSATTLGLRVDSEDGTRLVLHDRSIAGEPWPLADWRKRVGKVIHRPQTTATTSLILNPPLMPRWAKAAGKGERLMAFVGPTSSDPVLITVENHFIGLWLPMAQLDSDKGADLLTDNPWRDELPYASAE